MIPFALVVGVGLAVACWRAAHRPVVRRPLSEPPPGFRILTADEVAPILVLRLASTTVRNVVTVPDDGRGLRLSTVEGL